MAQNNSGDVGEKDEKSLAALEKTDTGPVYSVGFSHHPHLARLVRSLT
jgi:hypothetical protein